MNWHSWLLVQKIMFMYENSLLHYRLNEFKCSIFVLTLDLTFFFSLYWKICRNLNAVYVERLFSSGRIISLIIKNLLTSWLLTWFRSNVFIFLRFRSEGRILYFVVRFVNCISNACWHGSKLIFFLIFTTQLKWFVAYFIFRHFRYI